jgi:poly-beta-1,6-N-acetyl-D-glucosamine synthase
MLWFLLSAYIARKWFVELSLVTGMPLSIFIISGVALIPGYITSFMAFSLLMDRQPRFKLNLPDEDITILIAAWNEEKSIRDTLRQISIQDYQGRVHVILIDNNSSDRTAEIASVSAEELGLRLQILSEKRPGKHHALNSGLEHVQTRLMITLDADTLLHRNALGYIVHRMLSAPEDVCAVAGAILVRNSRDNIWAKIQEWDYFLAIASVKRLQGLYQNTLVAQGAFSLYKTAVVKEAGGWADVIGEDIVLTWRFLQAGHKVYFEPLSVAFTTVPVTLKHFAIQRSRWARGMIEGLKTVKPWEQTSMYAKYLTGINFIMPMVDVAYTLFWIPGLVLAFFGIFWIVGPLTLLVLPLTMLSYLALYNYQKFVFRSLKLRIRKNTLGFVLFLLVYQILMSPISVWGYLQELFRLERVWR